MTTFVELRATRLVVSSVEWCTETEAEQFSVYVRSDKDTFMWFADFTWYDDARDWAKAEAQKRNGKLIDHVEKERERREAQTN